MANKTGWIIALIVIGLLLLYSDFQIDLAKVGQTILAIALGWWVLTHKSKRVNPRN